MILGIDNLINSKELLAKLKGARIALLANQASVNAKTLHSLELLTGCKEIELWAAFGPQHGMKTDKQDNMIESDDYTDKTFNIPVYSLYGKLRRPTKEMMAKFDVLIIDLQDLGVRFYTYITTVLYMLEACSDSGKPVWVLDRPNPIGRPIEGSFLEKGMESFIGAASLPARYGLTIAELASFFAQTNALDIDLQIVPMLDYQPNNPAGYGWPLNELSWVNPSPNASSLNMARVYTGTALFEGTTLSEGRGTSNPLEQIGAPNIDFRRVLDLMKELAAQWLNGCSLRLCYFEPTFDKHMGQLCSGIQIHADNLSYRHKLFKPYRLAALMLKAIRLEYPDYKIWRDFYFEYEKDRLPIDLLSGSSFIRNWVDDPHSSIQEFEEKLCIDEQAWGQIAKDFFIYPRSA